MKKFKESQPISTFTLNDADFATTRSSAVVARTLFILLAMYKFAGPNPSTK